MFLNDLSEGALHRVSVGDGVEISRDKSYISTIKFEYNLISIFIMSEPLNQYREIKLEKILQYYNLKNIPCLSSDFFPCLAIAIWDGNSDKIIICRELLCKLEDKDLEWLILHEYAHIDRGDTHKSNKSEEEKEIVQFESDKWASEEQIKKRCKSYGISALKTMIYLTYENKNLEEDFIKRIKKLRSYKNILSFEVLENV